MKVRSFIYLLLFLVATSLVAQEDDAYKKFIKCSSVAIHKAQKEMVSAQKNEINGMLAKAVILQNNAIKLYTANNHTRAVCMSAAARKYAAVIIKNIDDEVDAFYLVHDDEKILLTNCADDIELYNESKRAAGNSSESDKDYITSFNGLTVGFN